MSRRLPIPPLAALLLASPALAGTNSDAYFALHWVPVTSEVDSCGVDNPNAQGIPCSDYTVTASLGEGYVFVVVANAGDEGVVAVGFGIDYNETNAGIDAETVSWHACSIGGVEFPWGTFPKGRSGIRLTFPNYESPSCYEHPTHGISGRHALIGYFYVHAYSEDVFRIVVPAQHYVVQIGPASGDYLDIVDCEGILTQLWRFPDHRDRMAKVHFGGDGSQAFNPCLGSVPVETTTWGGLKTLYRN